MLILRKNAHNMCSDDYLLITLNQYLNPGISLEIHIPIYNRLFDISSWMFNEHLKFKKSKGVL